MPFKDLSLDRKIESVLDQLGLTEPTPIQQQAIPAAMVGNDLVASSKTGSGKTLAFLLPALQRVMRQKALSKRDPRVLVLTPTRELASQVYGQLRSLLSATPYRSTLVVGGENFNDQAKALRKDPHFVVATPGRIANHYNERTLGLDGLELLILDEADRMLDLGFAGELKLINEAANHRLRQTLMFSATLEHAEVEELAQDLLKKPKRIVIDEVTKPHDDIRQRFLFCDHLDHKQALLQRVLQDSEINQAIIFTATRSDTDRLAKILDDSGFSTASLSGDLNQQDRNRIMDKFSRGQQQILITTDVASRGLDLLNVSLVINFDMPKHAEEYVHRIGRTGRAGSQGDAVSFVGPRDWDAFQRVKRYLSLNVKFEQIEGLEGKFKGIKPKPKKKVKAGDTAKGKHKTAGKSKTAQQRRPKRPATRRPAPELVSGDGLAPLKKKKTAAKPDDSGES